MKSNFNDVQRFHDKFGLDRDRPGGPQLLPAALLRFRLGFLIEELSEFAAASGATQVGVQLSMLAVEARRAEVGFERADLVGAFDALVDLNVVSLGTADFMGLPWEAGWDVVMAANNLKRRAAPDGSDSKRGSAFDVVKPEGWVAPEAALEQLVAQHVADTSRIVGGADFKDE